MNSLRLLLVVLLLATLGCHRSTPPKTDSNIDYYTCSMHPSVHASEMGKCPICGMDLVPVLKRGAAASADRSDGQRA